MITLPAFLGALAAPLKSYSYLGFHGASEILPGPGYDLEGRLLRVVLVGCPSYDTREGLWNVNAMLNNPMYPAFALTWADHAAYGVTLLGRNGRYLTTPARPEGSEQHFQIECLHQRIDVWAPAAPLIEQVR